MYDVFLKICSIEIYYSLTILPFIIVQYKLKTALLYIPHINKGDDWLKSYLIVCAFQEVLEHLIFYILPEYDSADFFNTNKCSGNVSSYISNACGTAVLLICVN
jgi:hypothetical protein